MTSTLLAPYAKWRDAGQLPPGAVLFYSAGRGDPAYKALSNFAVSPVLIIHPLDAALGLVRYDTNEHLFNACKTLDVADHEWIRTAPSAREAKKRGGPRGSTDPQTAGQRRISLRDGWDDRVRFDVMLDGCRAKFVQHLDLRELLLGTGERYLAEDSPSDSTWGVRDRSGGFGGHNYLGRCLMRVRAELRVALAR